MNTEMIDRAGILSMVPHQGSMCLLDAVLDWNDAGLRCRTDSHRHADNPLRGPDGLRAVHLCEYGAQAMAVHGGLLAQAGGGAARPGLLVSLRGVRLHRGHVHDLPGPLEVEAERLMAAEGSWQYGFRVSHQGELLAEGRAAVMLASCGAGLASLSTTESSRP